MLSYLMYNDSAEMISLKLKIYFETARNPSHNTSVKSLNSYSCNGLMNIIASVLLSKDY